MVDYGNKKCTHHLCDLFNRKYSDVCMLRMGLEWGSISADIEDD